MTMTNTETTMEMTNKRPAYDHTRPGAGMRPYRVRMTCGHGEWRLMREATAGVPWSEDVVIAAPSMPCARCRSQSVA